MSQKLPTPQTQPPQKTGRPKKAETIQVRVYRLQAAPHHAEMVEAFESAHEELAQEFAEAPEIGTASKLQPGRATKWGGEFWLVVAVMSGFVYLSKGPQSSLSSCARVPIDMVLMGCQ